MSFTIDSRFHSPNLPVVTLPPKKRLSSLIGVVTEVSWFSISLISFETVSNLFSIFIDSFDLF